MFDTKGTGELMRSFGSLFILAKKISPTQRYKNKGKENVLVRRFEYAERDFAVPVLGKTIPSVIPQCFMNI